MASEAISISASANDAHQDQDLSDYSHTATTLNFASSTSDAARRSVGMRFIPTTLAPKSKVSDAFLSLYLNTAGRDDANGDIYVEDADSSVTFDATPNDVISRTLTTATVAWAADNVGAVPSVVSSPSFPSSVQELVDRPGYVRNNAVTVLLRARNDSAKNLFFEAFDNAGTDEPILNLEYQPPTFRTSPMTGTGNGGPFFAHPLG